jgi:hypothetical protein
MMELRDYALAATPHPGEEQSPLEHAYSCVNLEFLSLQQLLALALP